MFRNNKLNIFLPILIVILLFLSLLPIFINLSKKNSDKNNIANISEFSIVDYDVNFAQNVSKISLINAQVKTTAKVDKVFINVNGVGVDYVEFTQAVLPEGYYLINITPIGSFLSTAFDSGRKIVADVYVEYGNRCYKVCSKDIAVSSCWTPFL